MKPGMVPEFTGSQPVALVNAQDNNENTILYSNKMGDKITASMHQMTDTAIQVLETELEKRNIDNSENADKQLRLAVHDVTMTMPHPWALRCTLHLKAETADGNISEYEAINNGNINRACGGAVLRAVAAMLNDDTIQYYLKN